MHLDILKDALEAVQMFAAGYVDVAVAIASGVALTLHALRGLIYQPKPKRKITKPK
jgi:hypothetical protein